ncbi:DUF4198 domain-containing protein [Pedobacter sp. JY14-1]|uniref:DUF4198 domain-containing protein n=1 Tax=Pedobacter sp. JY14-1 TaxID=3034151 RepID=UPI0023E18EC0|nr:DUF4198 domain-containing protein [Pedobacter sp. JY14-1]
MKKWNILMLTLVLSFISSGLFAHALWIETAATGKIGHAQTVKVFYGEYATGERDSIANWYSDVKAVTLWLTGPDQKKLELKLTPGANYYEASFTPAVNGAYTLTVSHEARELGGTTKYHFLSSAHVAVGKTIADAAQNDNVLKVHLDDATSVKLKKQVLLKAFLNSAAAAGKTVSVFSPSGWSKELTTDAGGVVSFIPVWAGRYVIEISDMDKTPGQHYGKDYKATWKGATYSFEVK